jgi:hypothetical protein|tara:strand:+ start:26687 stop:27160 length:474 start_codon:yes stop_codon:yes gene_type:complete
VDRSNPDLDLVFPPLDATLLLALVDPPVSRSSNANKSHDPLELAPPVLDVVDPSPPLESPPPLLNPFGFFHVFPLTAHFNLSLHAAAAACSYLLLAGVSFAHPYRSKNAFIAEFPPDFSMHASCSALHESIVALRTKLTCTPRDRWTPEQLRHRNAP